MPIAPRSTIAICPGFDDVPCGTVMKRDETLCGFCREERRKAGGGAPEAGDPVPAPAEESTPVIALGDGPRVHSSKIAACGRLAGGPKRTTDDDAAVTCGRCRRILAKSLHAVPPAPRPAPAPAAVPPTPVAPPRAAAPTPVDAPAPRARTLMPRELAEAEQLVDVSVRAGRKRGDPLLLVPYSAYLTVRKMLHEATGL